MHHLFSHSFPCSRSHFTPESRSTAQLTLESWAALSWTPPPGGSQEEIDLFFLLWDLPFLHLHTASSSSLELGAASHPGLPGCVRLVVVQLTAAYLPQQETHLSTSCRTSLFQLLPTSLFSLGEETWSVLGKTPNWPKTSGHIWLIYGVVTVLAGDTVNFFFIEACVLEFWWKQWW